MLPSFTFFFSFDFRDIASILVGIGLGASALSIHVQNSWETDYWKNLASKQFRIQEL